MLSSVKAWLYLAETATVLGITSTGGTTEKLGSRRALWGGRGCCRGNLKQLEEGEQMELRQRKMDVLRKSLGLRCGPRQGWEEA